MGREKAGDVNLSPDGHLLLTQKLDQMEKLGGPVPALKFRAARPEKIQLLNAA